MRSRDMNWKDFSTISIKRNTRYGKNLLSFIDIGAFNYRQLLLLSPSPIPLLVTKSVVANPDQTESRRTEKKTTGGRPFLSVAVYFEYLIFLFFIFFGLLALRNLNFFSSFLFNSQPGVTFEKFKEKKMKAFDKDKNKKFNKKELEKILNSP